MFPSWKVLVSHQLLFVLQHNIKGEQNCSPPISWRIFPNCWTQSFPGIQKLYRPSAPQGSGEVRFPCRCTFDVLYAGASKCVYNTIMLEFVQNDNNWVVGRQRSNLLMLPWLPTIDPRLWLVFQLIAHLKEEILTLKKQLATMMGEQKDEQLTADEMLKYGTSTVHPPSSLLHIHLSIKYSDLHTKVFKSQYDNDFYVCGAV